MRRAQIGRALLYLVSILAFSACSEKQEPVAEVAETPKEVRTVEQAVALFEEKLPADNLANARAALNTDLIRKNDSIGVMGSRDSFHHPYEYEWMLTIDQVPGAYFKHPVSYAFLTFTEPRLHVTSRNHLPTHNYEPIWKSVAEFIDDPNTVFDSSWLDRPPVNHGLVSQTAKLDNWPPRMSSDRCTNERRAYALLIHNLDDLESSPETQANLDMMAAGLEANGYSVLEFKNDPKATETSPFLNLAAPNGAGLYQLKNFVNIHRDFNDCCEEILVYMTGETGVDHTGRSALTYFELPFGYTGESKARKLAKRFYAEDLALLFSDLKTCHVNLVVDSNYAAGFAQDMLSIPQVESVITSCSEDEYTISSAVDSLDGGNFADPFSRQHGEDGSEFTSSFVKGIIDHANARISYDEPEKAYLIAQKGYSAAHLYDLGYLGGVTSPSIEARTMSSNCPCGIDRDGNLY